MGSVVHRGDAQRTLGLVWFIALLCAWSGCDGLQHVSDARHLTDTMQTQFVAAVDAANRAVLSSNGPATAGIVREADTARDALKQTEQTLSALLRAHHDAEEIKLLKDFHSKFVAYEVLDRSVLKLAIEKTNAQATRLSFGSGADTAQAFKDALRQLTAAPERDGAFRIRALTAEAVLAVREIQVLEAPHIAESSDEVMSQLEEKMRAAEAAAREALSELGATLGSEALAPANAAFTGFLATHAQIVALSRRNTEVRSLAMTLGQKRELISACQESLQALAQALATRLSKPTR